MEQSKCKIYKKCNGCQMQNLSYEEQIKWKQAFVGRELGRFGKIEPIIAMDKPYEYRNKVSMCFKKIKGDILPGIYQSKTNTVSVCNGCMLDNPVADKIIRTVGAMAKSFKLTPYDYIKQSGFLRHVVVRTGFATGEIMLVVVVSSNIFPQKQKFANAILKKHPEINTIVLNVSNKSNALVMGEHTEVLYGNGYINDSLCGLTFRISPSSFYQVNPAQTENLYNRAIELAHLQKDDKVLDAYCGTGTIGLVAAKTGAEVAGIELNEDAVLDARYNAKHNGIDNIVFYNGDAGKFMEQIDEDEMKPDVVIMDPPRNGSDRRFLSCLCKASPKKIVYVSCNPVSLSRDLRTLTHNGYKVETIQPVDMFPFTHHVECIALLINK